MKLSLSLLLLPFLGLANAQQEQRQEPVISVHGEDFYTWEDYLASAAFQTYGLRCKTEDRESLLTGAQFRPQSDCSNTNTTTAAQYEPSAGCVYEIPVVFHVISDSNGVGNMAKSRLDDQIRVLNEDFRALAGTPGANGTDTRIQFYLADTDPSGNPTDGVDRVTNDNWFADNGNYRGALAWDTNRYLNIYTNQASGALGYAYVPNGGGIVGTSLDGITLLYSAVGYLSPIGPPYNKGRTGTHEVGHWAGLFHTFSGGCGSPFCANSGDLICDTNPESAPVYGCPGSHSSCGSADPYRNYMDYTNDNCMTNFTPNQANRMRCTISQWRPLVHRPQCRTAASAVVRNGGSNPNVHSATLPILGKTQTYSVSTAPYDFAQIIGYAGAGSLVLGGGQVVLVDLGSPKYFQFPATAGPSVNLNAELPLDISFCSVPFTTQAVLFGGATPYALTNAVDHVLGGF